MDSEQARPSSEGFRALDRASRREKDPTERMKLELAMRALRDEASPDFLERQFEIIDGTYKLPS